MLTDERRPRQKRREAESFESAEAEEDVRESVRQPAAAVLQYGADQLRHPNLEGVLLLYLLLL